MSWNPNEWQPPGWQPDGWDPGETTAASAVLSGTILTSPAAAGVVAGGRTAILTLTNDTWIADITAVRQAILDGVTSVDAGTYGWNNEVRDKEVVGAVVRTSDTVVTITFTAAPAYQIDLNELIFATIPAAALNGGIAVLADPGFVIVRSKGMVPGVGRKPKKRSLSMRSMVHHIAGPEQNYPTYNFSGRVFLEKPKHNPFD